MVNSYKNKIKKQYLDDQVKKVHKSMNGEKNMKINIQFFAQNKYSHKDDWYCKEYA